MFMRCELNQLVSRLALAALLAGMSIFGVTPALAIDLLAGDLDHDGDVDVTDATLFAGCVSGPGVMYNGSEMCGEADIDHDGDVDLADFGLVQPCFSGPNVLGDPMCGGCVLPRANRTVGALFNQITSGDYGFVTVAASQEGVNYQLRDNSNNTSIGGPVPGTGDTVALPTGTLTVPSDAPPTTMTFNVLAINAIRGCSVQLTTTASITVIPYIPHNKIGVHVVSGSRNGFGAFIDEPNAANKPVALVKGVDDFGACYDAKTRTPSNLQSKILTVGRKNDLSSCSWGSNCDLQGFDAVAQGGIPPALHAQRVFNALKATWDANPKVDVWEVCNEWSAWWAWQADFYIAMMDICEATTPPAGHPPYLIAMYGASVGNPPDSAYPDFARCCARAKAHGGHMLALHEYGFFTTYLHDGYDQYKMQGYPPFQSVTYGSMVLRYRRLYDYLKLNNADCPLILTEVGQGGGGGFVGTSPFVQDFGWYDSELRKDPYVIGCAAWTLGNWSGANFQDALPALADYIVSQP
jgi:hypothetical protein